MWIYELFGEMAIENQLLVSLLLVIGVLLIIGYIIVACASIYFAAAKGYGVVLGILLIFSLGIIGIIIILCLPNKK